MRTLRTVKCLVVIRLCAVKTRIAKSKVSVLISVNEKLKIQRVTEIDKLVQLSYACLCKI